MAAALAGTLGLAAAGWGFMAYRMGGDMSMDMGVATPLGSFPSFIVMWTLMMAAMMLPGITPAALQQVRAGHRAPAVLIFVASYLVVWAVVGIPIHTLYEPHGTLIAGVITIAAGLYEFTPLKKIARRLCCEPMGSGFECGLYCVGASIGLMLMQVALGVMSLAWMAAIAVIVTVQKLMPAKPAIDTMLALVGLSSLKLR